MWDLMLANAVDQDVEDEVAPPAAVAPGKRTLTQAFAGLGLPDFDATAGRAREQVVELAYRFKAGGHDLTVSGQLKLRRDGLSVSATGTPPLATDASLQGKVTALSLQRKWYQEYSRGAGAKRTQGLLGRLTLSALKPGASLDGLLPGVKVALGGDLGQLRLENGLPSVNLYVPLPGRAP